MILVAAAVPVDGTKHDLIVDATTTMRNATLAEDGCVEYRFSFATDDPNTVLIFEEWRDQEALTAHFATPHMAAFQAVLGQVVKAAPVVTRYEATSKGPLR